MANNLTDKEYKEKYGTLTGVVTTDANGNTTRYSADEAAGFGFTGNTAALNNTPYYRTNDGKFSTDPLSKVSVSLDKNTGNIKVIAPKFLQDTDSFKQYFSDNTTLKMLSQAYKMAGDKATLTDENGNERKIEDLVNEANEDIQKLAKQYNEDEKYRNDYLRGLYGDKVDKLSMEQIERAGTAAVNIGDVKVTDTTRQEIPNFLLNQEDLADKFKGIKEASSWSKNTIERKDLIEKFLNTDNLSVEDYASIKARLRTALEIADWEGDEDEVARGLSFLKFLENEKPSADFGDNVVLAYEGWFNEAAHAATKTLFALPQNVMELFGVDTKGNWIDQINKFDEEQEAMYRDYSDVYSGAGNVGNLTGTAVVMIAEIVALGALTAGIGKVTSAGLSKFASFAGDAANIASKAETVGEAISGFSKIAGGAAKLAEYTATGIRVATGIMSSSQKAQLAVKLAESSKVMKAAVKVGQSTLVKNTFEFVVDTTMDCLMTDPNAVRTVLRRGDTDTYNYMANQTWQNAMNWAIFRGGGAIIKTAGKTKLGQAANIKLSQKLVGADLKLSNAKDWIKAKFLRTSAIESVENKLSKLEEAGKTSSKKYKRLATKKKYLEGADDIKAAKDAFAHTDFGNLFDAKNLKTARESLNKIKAVANFQMDFDKMAVTKAGEYDNQKINHSLGSANNNCAKAYDKILTLEGKSGKKTKLSKDGVGASQDAANYISIKMQYSARKKMAAAGGAGAEKAKASLRTYDKKLKNLEKNLSEDVRGACDEYVQASFQWYAERNRYATSKGIKNLVESEEIEESGIFDNGYARTESVGTPKEYTTTRKDGTVERTTEFKDTSYDLNETADFIDPEAVRTKAKLEMANVEVSNSYIKTMFSIPGIKKKLLMSSDKTEAVRKVASAHKNVVIATNNALTETISSITRMKGTGKVTPAGKKVSKTNRNRAVNSIDLASGRTILSGLGMEDGLVNPVSKMMNRSPKNIATKWEEYLGELNDGARKFLDDNGITSPELFMNEVKKGTDFEESLNRAYLKGDKEFVNSKTVQKIANNIEMSERKLFVSVKSDNNGKLIEAVTDKSTSNNIITRTTNTTNDVIDNYIDNVTKNGAVKKTMGSLSDIGGNATEDVTEYWAMKELSKAGTRKAVKEEIHNNIDKVLGDTKLSPSELKNIHEAVDKQVDDIIDSRLASSKKALEGEGATFDDADDLFDEVGRLNEEITKLDNEPNVVGVMNQNGQIEYYETSPSVANLYNRKYRIKTEDASVIAKANYIMSKAFRFGTTTFNLTSFGNQLFKDTGNAVLVGGAWKSMKSCLDDLEDVWGANVSTWMKEFEPYEYGEIQKMAKAQGISEGRAYAQREIEIGASKAGLTTEVQLYKDTLNNLYSDNSGPDNVLQVLNKGVNKAVDKVDQLMNGYREEYLRKRVYANNIDDALKQGYTNAQARVYAQFAMENATTNFSRSLYHLQSLAESTPYLSAAINGTKSFWRMFELDPVGINGRIFGGVVLPTMYLVGQSLANEENREIYKNLPEYEKANSLSFVINGQLHQIPLPEQVSQLVAPYRQFVEYLHGADQHSFMELMSNDLLGLSPINLQGFSTVDMDKMSGDPNFFDVVGRGSARVFSTLAPVPVKSAYMYLTKTDPYTGKLIEDTNSLYIDDDGNVVMKDYTQNEFAKLTSGLFGGNTKLSEKIIEGVLGRTTSDVLGFLTAIGKTINNETGYSWGSTGSYILGKTVERATAPYTGEVYDQVNAEWKRSVRGLERDKAAILDDKVVKALTQKINQEKDPEKRKKLIAERQNYKDEFDKKVQTTVDNLINKYGGTFDRYKYAAVVQLMNFETDDSWSTTNPYAIENESNEFYSGKNSAINRMRELNIPDANDGSIFGYWTTDKETGEAKIVYNTPSGILDMQNTFWGSRDINRTNVTTVLESKNIKTKKNEMNNQINAIRNKGKLSDADYDKIDALKMQFNNEVLKELNPIIKKVSPEMLYADDDMIKLLESYLYVPSEFEKVNNRYVSSGGGKLDKNMAFIRSYLKKVWEIK